MEVFLDCLPCNLRQALEASRMATDDAKLQDKIMIEAAELLQEYRSFSCSPDICRSVHRIIKKYTGVNDPYKSVKEKDTQTAYELLPEIKSFVESGDDRLYRALKAAATGNILDSAVASGVNFKERAQAELQKRFSICDLEAFQSKLETAKSLLIIGDNAGETVLDRLLMEQFYGIEITYAVRSAPIINDATIEDALSCGIDKIARVIKSGCDTPGTIISECSDEFLRIFGSADIVISKGQGNYETLSGCGRGIFFLLKAKCAVISRLLGVSFGDYVFKYEE